MSKHHFKFNNPYRKNGEPSRWKQVVDYIVDKGPVSKREIVKNIWGDEVLSQCILRGWCSSMFSQLNSSSNTGVHYNCHIKKWVPDGWEEKQILKAGMKIMRNSIYGSHKI